MIYCWWFDIIFATILGICPLPYLIPKDFCHQLTLTDLVRLENLPVTFAGAMRNDDTGLHSFLFFTRRGEIDKIVIVENTISLCVENHSMMISDFWALPWDIPRNLTIRSYGRAAGTLMEHEMDVIVLAKRYASDEQLSQDPATLEGFTLNQWTYQWKDFQVSGLISHDYPMVVPWLSHDGFTVVHSW